MSAPIADRLLASPALRIAREALAGRVEAWVVGGAVRDAALDRAVADVDLAVARGEQERAARAIASAPGAAAFPLSLEFGTWRALAADRSWHVDVTGLRAATIEGDLALRDFTVNALAAVLADPAGAPIDPTAGLDDVRRRVLRAVSERSLADDPLRVMRAARLAAQLGFELDPGTVALARAEAARAAEPAGERRLAELRMLLAGPDPLRGLRLLDELGATAAILPELEALRGVEQNPNHHLDVHGHTIEVLERLLEVEDDLERYVGESAGRVRDLLAEPLADEWTRGNALRLGAITHDFGKPVTRSTHDGWVTFIGHDLEGARIVEAALIRLRSSRALARHVGGLALHHLRLGFLVHERPVPARRLYDYLRATAPVAADVTLLTVADRLAARGAGATASAEMIAGHLELAREVLPAALEWHERGAPEVPLRGDELARALGIGDGPALGVILEEVRAGVFTGEVRTRDDALRVARSSLGDG